MALVTMFNERDAKNGCASNHMVAQVCARTTRLSLTARRAKKHELRQAAGILGRFSEAQPMTLASDHTANDPQTKPTRCRGIATNPQWQVGRTPIRLGF